jgi:hypothetical protein
MQAPPIGVSAAPQADPDATSPGMDGPTDRRTAEPASLSSLPLGGARIGWRRRVLLLAAVLGSLGIFMLARVMANEAHLAAEWHTLSGGRLQLVSSPLPDLRAFVDKELVGIEDPNGEFVEYDVLDMSHSSRWMTDQKLRQHLDHSRQVASHALTAGQVTLVFTDGSRVTTHKIGRASCRERVS